MFLLSESKKLAQDRWRQSLQRLKKHRGARKLFYIANLFSCMSLLSCVPVVWYALAV